MEFKRLTLAAFVLVAGLLGLALLNTGTPAHGAAPAAGNAPPVWGADIRVNPPTTATPDVQVNYSLAINPTNANQVLASYDSQDPTVGNSAYSWSTDAGLTWAGGRFYGPWISDTLPAGNTTVGFDSQGIAYALSAAQGANYAGYVVLTSTASTAWSTPIPITITDYSEQRTQARLVVDPRPSGSYAGSVYVAWHLFRTQDQGIVLRYSRDGGKTWSAETQVSSAGHEGAEQPSVAVAADGSVYAAYGQEDTDLWINRSTDGGATWGADQAISGGPITPIGGLDAENHELLLLGNVDGSTGVVITNDPRIAVARDNPSTVYAVWNDGRWESGFTIYGHPGLHSDVAFSRSTDGGNTWSPAARISDDAEGNGVDQWAPNIAVAPDGRIGVTWYDRRDDPDHILYNLYYRESADGGLTWSAAQRVSDVSNSPTAVYNGDGNGDLGDYVAFVYGPTYVLPSWVDSRAGNVHDFYTDRGVFVPNTATPTVPPTQTPPPPTATVAPPSATPVPPTATPVPPTATASPSATPCSVQFSDVPPNAYFAPGVLWLACHGVVSGYADGTFRPYSFTTRGQVTKLIVLGFGWQIQTPASPTFADVPPSQPFYSYIETAYAHNVINGYSCGGPGEPCSGGPGTLYFRPYADVTRGQLAKIVVLAKGWTTLTPATPTFVDVPASNAFYGFVERAYAEGVLSGYNCGAPGEPCPGLYFHPAAATTRGQLSKILYNVLTAGPR